MVQAEAITCNSVVATVTPCARDFMNNDTNDVTWVATWTLKACVANALSGRLPSTTRLGWRGSTTGGMGNGTPVLGNRLVQRKQDSERPDRTA